MSRAAASRLARRSVRAAMLVLTAGLPAALAAQETPVVRLGGLVSAEVRQAGFSLPRPMRVHVAARGGGVRVWQDGDFGTRLFASGWILNAATREVVWQMDGSNTRRAGDYRVADVELDLPAGRYEAYFADYGFGENGFLAGWTRNIDRRDLRMQEVPSRGRHSLLGALGLSQEGAEREWRRQADQYGMEVSVPASEAGAVGTFPAPLRWRNIVFSLAAGGDNGHWSQAFRLRKPVTFHVYAEGEGSRGRLVDTGWIVDLRTRKQVWAMDPGEARYAGGATKNRREVETITLPAGDYVATYVTDDSHSPADWNAQPPCDPGMYGLTLAVPDERELASVALIPEPEPGPVLAQLVRVRDDQDLSAGFKLDRAQAVRVYAIGEGDDGEMADTAWIEDAAGTTVWHMAADRTQPAGGAAKNRQVDELVPLPKGVYTLHVRTDGSHAFGEWNAARPWDAGHYGATVYAVR